MSNQLHMWKFFKGQHIFSYGTWETFSFLALEAWRKDHTAINLLLKTQHLLNVWYNFLPVAAKFWKQKKIIPEPLPTVNGHIKSISEASYVCGAVFPGWGLYVQHWRWSIRRSRAWRDLKIQRRKLWMNRNVCIKATGLEQSPMLNNSFICLTGPGDVIMP